MTSPYLPDFRSPGQTLGKTDPLRGGLGDGLRHDLITLQGKWLRLHRVIVIVVFLLVIASVIRLVWVFLVERVQIVLLYKCLQRRKRRMKTLLERFKMSSKLTYKLSVKCYEDLVFSPGTSLLLFDEIRCRRRRRRGSHSPHYADAVLRQRRQTQRHTFAHLTAQ